MEKVLVSPGVFTREKDVSSLPQGIAQIGAAIIGPTTKGPAFIPTLVSGYSDFVDKFGEPDGTNYTAYTVKNYLNDTQYATVVRVVGLDGYKTQGASIKLNYKLSGAPTGSAFNTCSIGIIVPTNGQSTMYPVTASVLPTDIGSINLNISGANMSMSLDPNDTNYIENIISSSPVNNSGLVYLYSSFNSLHTSLSLKSLVSCSLSVEMVDISITGSEVYSVAETPFIKSQTINGSTYDLFKFYTYNANSADIKISIQDIKEAGTVAGSSYGSFTVLVRKLDDTDKRPVVLESFSVNLDPKSSNYIVRAIGDQYREFVNGKLIVYGDYPNKSKFVRVEMPSASVPVIAVPYGFGAYTLPIAGAALTTSTIPTITMVSKQQESNGLWNSKKYLGFDFSITDNNYVYKPVVSGSSTGSNTAFSLENTFIESGSTSGSFNSLTAPITAKKFSVAFQGGFDGLNPCTPKNVGSDIISSNTMGFDLSTSTSQGTRSYLKAISTISNPDEFDINMIVTPGLLFDKHKIACDYANTVCEDRGDAFYIVDSAALTDTVDTVCNSDITNYDSNYAGTYYPWVKILDLSNDKYVWVPPSTVMAGVFAHNDSVAAEWWAPAGLNRGGIESAVQVYTRLTQDERDSLYLNRINPITTFVNTGIVAWGQKTLQISDSALSRINVRRLLTTLKKYIASTTKYLVFEQSTNALQTRFKNIVTPYMDSVKNNQGLYAFEIVMDSTNNTAEVIDRNMLVGLIRIQPTRTSEIISIDFEVNKTGATFGTATTNS